MGFLNKNFFFIYLVTLIFCSCSFSSDGSNVVSIMDTDKGKELGEEALNLIEGEAEAVSDIRFFYPGLVICDAIFHDFGYLFSPLGLHF